MEKCHFFNAENGTRGIVQLAVFENVLRVGGQHWQTCRRVGRGCLRVWRRGLPCVGEWDGRLRLGRRVAAAGVE